MVTCQQEAPLLFLNTSNSLAPTGRNARAQARSESARRTNPATARYGSFGSFSIDLKAGGEQLEDDYKRQPKRRKTCYQTLAMTKKEQSVQELNYPRLSIRILATHFNQACPPLPPNVNFEDVLKVAAFHVRRRTAQVVKQNPERMLDALRCRQWCSVSSTVASLGRTPYLDSAIACVVSKVQQVVSGANTESRMLFCYTEALRLLREAVLQPALHDRVDMLAATQLLAIYEMLDESESSWTQHVAGAATIARLQDCSKGESIQPAALFVEALLNDDETFFESQHWKTLLQSILTKQYPGTHMTYETISCFTTLRSILASSHALLRTGEKADWSARFPLLSRAHELRERIILLIVQNKDRFLEARRLSNHRNDVLGLCLVSLIMLDKLILALRQRNAHRGMDLEGETQDLCTLMVNLEINAAEFNPGKDLLKAFQRQVNYPSLTYDGEG